MIIGSRDLNFKLLYFNQLLSKENARSLNLLLWTLLYGPFQMIVNLSPSYARECKFSKALSRRRGGTIQGHTI